MQILSQYINGNYNITLYDDGTKIRTTPDGETPYAEFPENIDIKLTDKCSAGCSFCHENSTPHGRTADFDHPFIDTLKPGTELACGGGNLFEIEKEKLTDFFTKLKKQGVFPSVTVNQIHLNPVTYKDNIETLSYWLKNDLIKGVGISYNNNPKELKEIFAVSDTLLRKRAVIHVINGIHDLKSLENLSEYAEKILILGYKTWRRGETYKEIFGNDILKKQKSVYDNIHGIIKKFDIISFDNLAIDQLNLKRLFLQDKWQKFYMGDEGHFTMYIDLVNKKFAKNSYAERRYDLKDNIEEMFEKVKEI